MDNTQTLAVRRDLSAAKEKNIGISCLKMLMCLEVITCHYAYAGDRLGAVAMPFYRISEIAVPAFMFASFYLTANKFLSPSREKTVARCKRLLVPFVGWGILSFFLTVIICLLPNSEIISDLAASSNEMPTVKDLFWQLLAGHSFMNAPLWFLWDMMVITILFMAISSLSQKYFVRNILLLAAGCVVLQYSGLNDIFYGLRYELRYPLGRLAEMIPIAALGIAAAYSGFLEAAKRSAMLRGIIVVSALALYVTMPLVWSGWSEGFGFYYAGIPLMIKGFLFFCVFFFLPFEALPDGVKAFLSVATQFTLGIYCIHIMVGKVVLIAAHSISPVLPEYRFALIIVIYAAGYALCWLINKINHPLARQLVN